MADGEAKPGSLFGSFSAGARTRGASPMTGREAISAYRADGDSATGAAGGGTKAANVAATPVTPITRGNRIAVRYAPRRLSGQPFRLPALGGACFGASFVSVGYLAVIQSGSPPASALARKPWRISVAATRALTSSSGSES